MWEIYMEIVSYIFFFFDAYVCDTHISNHIHTYAHIYNMYNFNNMYKYV